jgi:SP family general alpha glucoside:H+ symporter-like MFS transporter
MQCGYEKTLVPCQAETHPDKEHKMTLREGLRLYPKAIAWSVLISSICAMEGYDVALIGNFCTSCWNTEAGRS